MVLDKIHRTIVDTPNAVAIVDLSTETPVQLTYEQLNDLADRCAARLLQLGIEAGEPVAYQLPGGWEFIVLTLALWRISAVPCPLLPSLREREAAFILKSSRSRVFIVPDSFRKFDYPSMVETLRPDVPNLEHVFILNMSERNPEYSNIGGLLAKTPVSTAALQAVRAKSTTYAQLLYTSGTTGEPKGVLHTHQSLSSALLAHTRTLGLQSSDKIWIPSPLAHQTGFLYGMMVSFYIGATAIVQAVWNVDTARIAIEEFGATFVQAAMPFLADLTKNPRPPKGLRLFIATGAAIPRQLAQQARSALDCTIVGAWGSTEACLVTVGRPSDAVEKLWGTDGRVIDGMQIRIVDENGMVLPAGHEGNFQIKTPAMFLTYLHHHEWYEEGFSDDGYFDTGDLAVIDEDGYLRITGRKKDVVNRGGEKIPVVEIEDLLYQHEAIADAAVVAMPDNRLGERACLYIVVNDKFPAPALDDVRRFLANQGMAKIYWPERLETISEMPRTASGKIQKYILRNDIVEKLSHSTQNV
ncbi:AMP-binding protein [Alicyclobacillus sp. SO9]|nr:AMP-binding protein [Alicyclobacillus sp. SO9]